MNKRALMWAIISFIPLIGQFWWAYRVSEAIISKRELKKDEPKK